MVIRKGMYFLMRFYIIDDGMHVILSYKKVMKKIKKLKTLMIFLIKSFIIYLVILFFFFVQ